MKQKIALRSKAKKLSPLLRIGKLGLSDGIVKELNNLLEKKKLVKIKLLGTSIDGKSRKDVIAQIILKTNSELIDSIGNMVVLYKSK